jgi:hypothetical protein
MTTMEQRENIGKDFPKIKRGRPRLLDAASENMFRTFVRDGEPATLRTIQNSAHSARAIKVLCDGPSLASVTPETAKRLGWLLRPDASGVTHVRKSIMYQLGRTKNKTALCIFAERVCEMKPTAQAAIRMLQRWQQTFEGMLACYVFSGDDITEDLVREAAKRATKLR